MHAINGPYLWHELQHGFLHVDKGIFFTIKELFTRPGNSIREFIEGRRVRHFKPLSLVIILAGLYGFLMHFLHINVLAGNVEVTGDGPDVALAQQRAEHLSEWVATHYWIISMVQIPVWAAATRLAFFKQGYNYFEHFVLHSFLVGQRLALHIALVPLYYLLNGTPALRYTDRALGWVGLLLMAWSLLQFFRTMPPGQRIARILLAAVIALALMLALFLLTAPFLWNAAF